MTSFQRFAETCRRIEAISGSIEITGIVADFLRDVDVGELDISTRFVMGRVFPVWSQEELGIGPSLLYSALAKSAGVSEKDIENLVRDTGDVGLAASSALGAKTRRTLGFVEEEALSISEVYSRFSAVAGMTGKGSQSSKINKLKYLFSMAKPDEAVYLARLAIEELRIGVGEGIVRDAIAAAFNVPVELVERGYMLTNDPGIVAVTARSEGENGLLRLGVSLFKPVKMMLAQVAESIESAVTEMGAPAVEWKFDGARVQIHKSGDSVRIYSRRLENVTASLPDVVRAVKVEVTAREAILDGETVATGENGKPMAFQEILRRFRRKYNVSEMAQKIPLHTRLFDILYKDGKSLIDTPLLMRRQLLESCASSGILASQKVTSDIAEINSIYQQALDAGHEGIMLKNPASLYTPGKRGKNWLKFKPLMETLDLVVIGGEWGEGRRAHLVGSYMLACRDPDTGEFLPIGRVGTGLTDEMLTELTGLLKALIIRENGKLIEFEPKKVFEIAFEEIQKSPNYDSGFALRFPRLVRVRDEKSPDDCDTIERVEQLYAGQRT
ncbi:MAG TPA: ATP-dependent DNA ligase [Candidatus Methanoperedenaceae archaeon]|nr:ATP-dependent DNA ligase [Candidatus Methanoperedenaceae archaeon]